VKIVDLNFRKLVDVDLISGSPEESYTLASDAHWIPFSSTSLESEFQAPMFQMSDQPGPLLQFNAIPSIASLKLAFVKMLLSNTADVALVGLFNVRRGQTVEVRKAFLVRTCELISHFKHALSGHSNRAVISSAILNQTYYEAISRIGVLESLLLIEIADMKTASLELPKWKGRAMQFIELISIGIELDMFEGRSQNQICNSLLKAFQVDAQSDQPIYKQRFDALFRRSKVHLPLIAEYIHKVEEAKQMKVTIRNG
jgi:hypothetical protein